MVKVEACFSQSLDGVIACSSSESNSERQSKGLTNDEDREFLLERLDTCDLVLTTRRTMRPERGALRNKHQPQVPWGIATTQPGISEVTTLPVWNQRGVKVKTHTVGAPGHTTSKGSKEGSESEQNSWFGSRHLFCQNWSDAVSAFELAGFSHILLLGGPELFFRLNSAGLVDELSLSLCPIISSKTNQNERSGACALENQGQF